MSGSDPSPSCGTAKQSRAPRWDDRIEFLVRVEEPNPKSSRWKGWMMSFNKDAVERPIVHSNVRLLMLAKGVHGSLQVVGYLEA
jgi:hypothetical protein